MTCASSPGSTCTASNSSTPSARRWPLNGTSRNGGRTRAVPPPIRARAGRAASAAAARDSESTTATRANCGPWPPSLDAASSSSRACRSCSHAVARAATKTRAHVRQTAARDRFTSEREIGVAAERVHHRLHFPAQLASATQTRALQRQHEGACHRQHVVFIVRQHSGCRQSDEDDAAPVVAGRRAARPRPRASPAAEPMREPAENSTGTRRPEDNARATAACSEGSAGPGLERQVVDPGSQNWPGGGL